jgi:hypothetical protein
MAASIRVRYLGPTDNKGARHVVSCEPYRSIAVAYDYALGVEENERAAMLAFIATVPSLAGRYTRTRMGVRDVLYVSVADAIDFQP